MRSLALAKIENAREPWLFTVAEVSADNWWCASIPAKELPVGQAVPRRLVNVRIPRILIGMQGASLRGGNFVLPPDHEHLRRVDVAEEHERRPGCTMGQSWLWDDQV